ncbi:hypothetical protein [Burkholderia sp. JKS000303]|uniref:hypothetical protein n=1 Tax=Burkholderia sp. JKS000303 TaxID=1938747 RepID=UPI0015CF2243|nr:hypothetical protein [Burkholderia sp. JKS000303]
MFLFYFLKSLVLERDFFCENLFYLNFLNMTVIVDWVKLNGDIKKRDPSHIEPTIDPLPYRHDHTLKPALSPPIRPRLPGRANAECPAPYTRIEHPKQPSTRAYDVYEGFPRNPRSSTRSTLHPFPQRFSTRIPRLPVPIICISRMARSPVVPYPIRIHTPIVRGVG